jgi:hypothetical protein
MSDPTQTPPPEPQSGAPVAGPEQPPAPGGYAPPPAG